MFTTARRAAFVLTCAALIVFTAAGLAGAAGRLSVPQPGPLNPAFVESLHDPLAGVFGKRP